MIFRNYNTNPVIDVRPRWKGCMRSTFSKKMKTIQCIVALTVLALAVVEVQAEEVAGWPTKSMVIDTGWVDLDPSTSCPETHYPVCFEIMPLQGDGVRYKAVFIPKPQGDFDYKSAVGIRTEEYEKMNKELIAEGYTQISHQVVTVMVGNVHQAVWVSRNKIENKAEMATPSKPSD